MVPQWHVKYIDNVVIHGEGGILRLQSSEENITGLSINKLNSGERPSELTGTLKKHSQPVIELFIKPLTYQPRTSGERTPRDEIQIENEIQAATELVDVENVIKPIRMRDLGKSGDSPVLYCSPEGDYFIIYEKFNGKNMVGIELSLSKLDEIQFDKYMIKVLEGILVGLNGIHNKGWVHNDIKLENIMVSELVETPYVESWDGDQKKYVYDRLPGVLIIDLDGCEKCSIVPDSCESSAHTTDYIAPVRYSKLFEETPAKRFNGIQSDLVSTAISMKMFMEAVSDERWDVERLKTYTFCNVLERSECIDSPLHPSCDRISLGEYRYTHEAHSRVKEIGYVLFANEMNEAMTAWENDQIMWG